MNNEHITITASANGNRLAESTVFHPDGVAQKRDVMTEEIARATGMSMDQVRAKVTFSTSADRDAAAA